MCATTSGLNSAGEGAQGFLGGQQTLYQLSNILNPIVSGTGGRRVGGWGVEGGCFLGLKLSDGELT